MAPFICCSNSMFRYLLVDHAVPAMWRSLAAARLSADWPSGNAPTTRVRRRISRRMRSSGLLVRNPPPVLLREGVVGERLLDRRFHQLGGAAQAQATQLLDHSGGLLARCRDVLAGVDRLEHGRDLPHLGRGHVTEDVAEPVHDAPLPGRLWKELCGALGKPNAGIRDDEPDALQAAFLKMLEEFASATLVLLRPFANAENLPIAARVHADRNQQRGVAHLAGPAALEHDAIEINIRVLALDRTISPGLDRPVDLLV